MPRMVKKRKPLLPAASQVAADVSYGLKELQRQSGQAVENVKSGVRKIKQFVKK